jgi:AcrR family transcriptional regulator
VTQHTERADARANRARLIAAAHALFRERGLNAEMKEIAERAGVGVGTIYRNFPTKDDLVGAIVMEAIGEIRRTVEECALIDDPVEAIRAFLSRGFDVSERYGDVMMAVLGGGMPPDCAAQFAEIKELDLFDGIVRAGVERGIFRPDLDPGIVSAQAVTAFTPWSYQELRQTRSQQEITDAYVDMILHGVLRDSENGE